MPLRTKRCIIRHSTPRYYYERVNKAISLVKIRGTYRPEPDYSSVINDDFEMYYRSTTIEQPELPTDPYQRAINKQNT